MTITSASSPTEIHVVTGAFGFSGRYVARKLLAEGFRVRTLTNSRRRNPFDDAVQAFPMDFTKPDTLMNALHGATVLYNTYWVRFEYAGFSYSAAVENTKVLFRAAKDAGIQRIVHISITNPSAQSRFEYFRGKALIEDALLSSGVSCAIVRPALIFGDEGILINNIAWLLRRFPVFGVFGTGEYRLQPVYVDDLAALMVVQGKRRANVILDAVGPETFRYRELVALIGAAIGCPRPLVPVPDWAALAFSRIASWFLEDVLITRDELEGLKADLLVTGSPPAGTTRLSDWLRENAGWLGKRYMSELARRNCLSPSGWSIGRGPSSRLTEKASWRSIR